MSRRSTGIIVQGYRQKEVGRGDEPELVRNNETPGSRMGLKVSNGKGTKEENGKEINDGVNETGKRKVVGLKVEMEMGEERR